MSAIETAILATALMSKRSVTNMQGKRDLRSLQNSIIVSLAGFGTILSWKVPANEIWIIKAVTIFDNVSKFPICQLAVGSGAIWMAVHGVATPIYLGGIIHSWHWDGEIYAMSGDLVRAEILTNTDGASAYAIINYEVIHI